MPPPGKVEFYSQLARGKLINLCVPNKANDFKPPVRSISLRPPGCVKGRRLIVLEGVFGKQMGLLTYLRALLAEQDQETEAVE